MTDARRISDVEILEMRKSLEELRREFYKHSNDEHEFMRENAKLIAQNSQAIKELTLQSQKMQQALECWVDRTSTAVKVTDNLVATGQTLSWIQKAFLWLVKWGAIVTGLTAAIHFVQNKQL